MIRVLTQTLLLNLFFLPFGLYSQDRAIAFAINERLGKGMNMGNAFEAPSETAWGNPWNPQYFVIMAEMGFDHVRIPIRWEPADRSMATAPYTVSPVFLNRVKEVVDEALKNKLQPIINMHHHEALYDDPAGQKERFLSQWEQIAVFFQDYSDSLLFEVLNEPHGNLSPALWNDFFADALVEIRKTNPTRCVLMGTADYGGLSGLPYLALPDDEYIIVSVHYYNPFQFTHQGAEWVGSGADDWLGTQWYDTEAERASIESEFSALIQFSNDFNIPVHIGEFGAYSKADLASRVRWTTFLARWFEQQGFSWAYWEFSAGFGIYNPQTQQILTVLSDALLVNPMPEATPITISPVYSSNFTSGNDGWNFAPQAGASGSLITQDGRLVLTLTQGGTEGWHAQLSKSGVPLVKDKMYRFSFKAVAPMARGLSCYIGRASSPWNAYSGFFHADVGTSEKDFVYTFTMSANSDPSARIVFDAGNFNSGFSIWDVKLEMISIGPTQIGLLEKDHALYPNPVSGFLLIDDMLINEIIVYNLEGEMMLRQKNSGGVDIQSLPMGFYFVVLISSHGIHRMKIVKE